MESLFKKPKNAQRVYRAQSIDSSKNIVQTMSISDHKDHVVCLCLANRVIKKRFTNKWSALNQLKENQKTYNQVKG